MPATHGGQRYFLLLVDDCTRYMWLHKLTSKDEVPVLIKTSNAEVETEIGKMPRILRTNRSGEFNSIEFGLYCAEQGIECHLATPYHNRMVSWRGRTKRSSEWLEACSRRRVCWRSGVR